MIDELENLWGKLSFTEEEFTEVVIEKDWLEEAKEAGKNFLIGKLLLNKRVNVKAMKNVLCNVWKVLLGMSIKEVGNRLFVFHFQDDMENERVLLRQLWSFNKSLLVLQNLEENVKLEDVKLQRCSFWVQIHGLPLGLMTEKIRTILGESIGDVEEVDIEGEQMAWGCYLRVRVSINISKQLKKGSKIIVLGSGNELVIFKYEKLPDFCYVYGRLDHQEIECDETLNMKKVDSKAKK
ncbi:hypothetical protein CRYUN_Cryun07bG0088500 [Craigia yunnanensis]